MTLPAEKSVDLGPLRLTYRERGSGPALMFVHGMGGGSAAWQAQYDFFAGRCRVIAWDSPGYGGSGGLEADEPAVADYVDMLIRFFDAAGIETAHLAGHSLGGVFVAAFAKRYPERVRSLALLQAVAGYGSREPAERQDQIAARRREIEAMTGAAFAELRARSALAPGASKALVARAAAVSYSTPARGYLQQWAALCSADIFGELAGVDKPAIVIGGEHDKVATQGRLAAIAEAIPGARTRTIAGAGHVIYMEAPDALNACLAEFLDSID